MTLILPNPSPAPARPPRARTGRPDQVQSGGTGDLPPSARSSAQVAPRERTRESRDRRPARRRIAGLGALALLAGLFLAAPWQNRESAHGDWRSHDQASKHWDADQKGMKWVSPLGPAVFENAIVVGADDLDAATTGAVADAVRRHDVDAAEKKIREAQRDLVDSDAVFAGIDNPPAELPARPTLTEGLRQEILYGGDPRFYHIYLYDSCAEDGDVVDLVINDQRFATVRITNAGTTLSVPVSSAAPTVIAVRGVWDGGGGITVACRTSQGEGFIRVMAPGEEQPLAVIQR